MKTLFTSFLLILFFSLNGQPKSMEIFQIVEQMPRFPGCEDLETKRKKENCATQKLYEYINDNLQYPEEALKKEIEGRVTVRFAVRKDGSIGHIKVLRDIGGGCGEEAKRIVLSMNEMENHWIPGKQGGIKKHVWYTLPILFRKK